MAAPMEQQRVEEKCLFDDRLCEIEATCPTGFENIVREDVEEKLGCKVNSAKGKVYVFVPFNNVTKLLQLYSLDNLYVIIKHYDNFKYEDKKESVLEQLKGIVPEVDWEFGLKVWAKFIQFEHEVSPKPQLEIAANSPVHGDQSSDAKKRKLDEEEDVTVTGAVPPVSKPVHNPLLPAFRATCYRSGMSHSFQSPEVAHSFGGAVQDYFGWNVKMKNFDIEVVINIDNHRINIAIALTKQSMHRRHIVEFGHCTLRPTIAYSMLRLCDIKSNDVVCDPMCGTGSIPMEVAVNWPNAVTLCGDVQKVCVEKTQANINALNEKRVKSQKTPISIDVICWDSTKLPFPDGQVDVIVSDMPFGKRSGSKTNNMMLYPMLFKEWARAARPVTGRACLLTQDRKSIQKTMQKAGKLWHQESVHYINIGGIIAGVFLFTRSDCTDYKLTQA